MNDVALLARVTWREARGEPRAGKAGVAYSILNRVLNPAWWGNTVSEVIWKKWQYSSMTAPGDRQLAKEPTPWFKPGWDEWLVCLDVAYEVYAGREPNPAPGADHYFADTIPPPRWADPGRFVVKIGRHSFYNLGVDREGTV